MSLLRTGKGKHRIVTARNRTFVPRLVTLEDRTLPSLFSTLLGTISTSLGQVLSSFTPSTPTPITYTVTNLNDSGAGSLRQAVLDANAHPGPDVINFASGLSGTITLTSGQLMIFGSVSINGPGSGLTVSGNDASRVFSISAPPLFGRPVSISGLEITHGKAGQGAGILNFGASLTLDNVVLSNNVAQRASGEARGGGILNLAGKLTVANSTFTDNVAQ